jgi:hypothetical protein
MLLVIVFIVTARAWLPHMVFSISPTIGNFHKLGNSLWLLPAEFFDIGFSSDAVAKSINRPIDGDIFGSIQVFSKTPNVHAKRLRWFLMTLQ